MARRTTDDRSVIAKGLGGRQTRKAAGGGDSVVSGRSNQPIVGEESADKWFSAHGAIPVPFNPNELIKVFEESNCLRQMVDAYAVNVYGTGWVIEPVIDLDSEGADQEVSDAMYAERLDTWIAEGSEGDLPEEPTEDEVVDRMNSLRLQLKREMFIAEAFFRSCSVDQSFISLCRMAGTDKEITGNAYWECIRSKDGRLARLSFMPSTQTRLCTVIQEPVVVNERRYVSPIKYEDIEIEHRFRQYMMEVAQTVVYFKEFGDPRVMSRKTGKVFADEKTMYRELNLDENTTTDGPANEVLHFRVPSVRTPYGIPRWIGVLLEIMGSRAAGEINYDYFDSKGMPPFLILMSGGHLSAASEKLLTDFFADRVRGRENFHRGVMLQSTPNLDADGRPQDVKMQIERLSSEQTKDSLFQGYDAANIEKVGAMFRLPQLLRGVVKDVNKASAKATLQFAEEQVFGPERLEFDWTVNNNIVNDLGLTLVKFRSNGIQTSDPVILTEMIEKMMTVGGLTINEARALLSQVFKKRFPPIDQFWANQPLELTKIGVVPDDMQQTGDMTVAEQGESASDGQCTEQTSEGQDGDTLAGVIASLKRTIEEMKSKGAKVQEKEHQEKLKAAKGIDIDGSVIDGDGE